MPYLDPIGVGEIDTRINEGKRFNVLENNFIEAITDKHPLNGREIAGQPSDILLYPDVRKMSGITPPESSYRSDLLFHVTHLPSLNLFFHGIFIPLCTPLLCVYMESASNRDEY
jgi:hypothetical protein